MKPVPLFAVRSGCLFVLALASWPQTATSTGATATPVSCEEMDCDAECERQRTLAERGLEFNRTSLAVEAATCIVATPSTRCLVSGCNGRSSCTETSPPVDTWCECRTNGGNYELMAGVGSFVDPGCSVFGELGDRIWAPDDSPECATDAACTDVCADLVARLREESERAGLVELAGCECVAGRVDRGAGCWADLQTASSAGPDD